MKVELKRKIQAEIMTIAILAITFILLLTPILQGQIKMPMFGYSLIGFMFGLAAMIISDMYKKLIKNMS